MGAVGRIEPFRQTHGERLTAQERLRLEALIREHSESWLARALGIGMPTLWRLLGPEPSIPRVVERVRAALEGLS